MANILVAGGAGFIGSNLCRELVARGHHVTCLDLLISGLMSNIADLLPKKEFAFINADITKPIKDLEPCFEQIYHLASPASPRDYQRYPLETITANTLGVKNLLEFTQACGGKMLYTSTSEVYGDPEVHPQPENYRGSVQTWGPRACYDESKRLGETLCYEFFAQRRARVTVVRLFNTYSSDLKPNDGRVISTLVMQALNGQDLTVYGDGSQTRSFCFVTDTIRGIISAMEEEAADGEIINLGNPEELTILEMAEWIRKITNAKGEIIFQPLPADDPRVRRPDISKAWRLLGWKPQVSLAEGLQMTIEGYRFRLAENEVAATVKK